jgi:signal peptidase II
LTSSRAEPERRRRIALLAGVALLVTALDQVTKSLAVAGLRQHGLEIAGPIAFRLAYNSGVAFSIGTSLTGPIIIVAVVLIGALAWFARHVPTTVAAVGVGMILGGAVGNLADRVFRGHHGAVVDFIYTRYWPTFNVADASIVCGCAIVAWSALRQGGPRSHESAGPGGDAAGLSERAGGGD